MHVAVLGAGLLGRPVAERLHRTGHSVTVYNRSRQKTERLAELGITVAASPREAVESSDRILLLLADAEAIRAVLLTSQRNGSPDGSSYKSARSARLKA